MSIVSIVKARTGGPKGIERAVRQAIALAGGLQDIIKPQDTVLIKPNLVAVPLNRLTGAITRWEVCKAIADMVREMGARPVIAESAAAGVDTEKVIAAGGYNTLRAKGYEVVDLKRSPKRKILCPKGVVFKEMGSWELVTQANVIISVPVMKTHDQTEVTISLKNLKGLIDDQQKKEFHKQGLLEGVVDLALSIKPKFTVIDGTIAQEGLGPIFGNPVKMGLIIASKDLVAADAVGSEIMGYDPKDVMITTRAAARGLGVMDPAQIEIKGVPIQEVRRRFQRSCETTIEGLPPFELLLDEGACTGCRNTVISAIMDMKSQNLQHSLQGKVIVAGPLQEFKIPQKANRGDIVLVGICTKPLQDRGVYIPGCPPNNLFVVRGIVGNAGSVERRYATEEGTDIEDG
jgi:uncharacterized protein (DUF362 family)